MDVGMYPNLTQLVGCITRRSKRLASATAKNSAGGSSTSTRVVLFTHTNTNTNTNTNSQIQIYKYKFTNTNLQIQIYKYKYKFTNTKSLAGGSSTSAQAVLFIEPILSDLNKLKYQLSILLFLFCRRHKSYYNPLLFFSLH